MADQARPADAEELLGREVGVVDTALAVDHDDRLGQRIEDGARELLVHICTSKRANGHVRQPAFRRPAGRTTQAAPAPCWPRSRDYGKTELGRGGQALRVPAEMLARHAYAGLAAVMLEHRVEVHAHRRILLGERRIGQALAGAQVVHGLIQEPRPTISAAADHDAVGPRLLERIVDVVQGLDIAVGDHRQSGRRLDLADEAPVGMAVVEVAAGAAVHSQHLDARLLGDARQVWGVAVGRIPAGAHLQGHRELHRLDGRLEDLRGMNLVAHQRRAGMAIHDLLHGAAEVDVDDGRPAVLVQPGRIGHDLGLAAGELDRHREFFGRVLGHQQRLAVLPHHGCRGDHLGHDQACPAALHHLPERHVGDAGHGRQDDRLVDANRADFYRAKTGCTRHTLISL